MMSSVSRCRSSSRQWGRVPQPSLQLPFQMKGERGGIGSLFRSTAAVKRDIDTIKRLTTRPFAINHIPQALDAEAFRYTLDARPPVISFALDDPGDMVRQAHEVGSRIMLQVTTVVQAVRAAERGVDVIIAQGGEFGGYCGEVSTMALVPQVVDAVAPIPVVAAGGIFDGRGIAAALMLGAAGVNFGTRFIASIEAPAPNEWKEAITAAQSEDVIKVDVLNDISPIPGTNGFPTIPRSIGRGCVPISGAVGWATQRPSLPRLTRQE